MLNKTIRFYVTAGIFAFGAAAASSASMSAVISATVGGAPVGATVYENFDSLGATGGATSTGMTVSFMGTGARPANHSKAGYYAAPIIEAGSAIDFGNEQGRGADQTQYLTSGMGQVIMELDEYHQYFGLLWGSVGNYESLSFYDQDTLLFSVTGLDIKNLVDGNHIAGGTYYVNITSDDYFNKVIASSTKYGLEFDNVALASNASVPPAEVGAVPEPGTLALLGLGVFAGISARRRRTG